MGGMFLLKQTHIETSPKNLDVKAGPDGKCIGFPWTWHSSLTRLKLQAIGRRRESIEFTGLAR